MMKKIVSPCLLLGAFSTLALTSLLGAETYTIYAEDFSGIDTGRVFTNQDPWWSPNWNGGDLVQSTANNDGPGGVVAFTRSTQVIAGRFYGGGIRGPNAPIEIPANASSDPADMTLSLWLKATSSQSRGPVGISVISKDADGANTGAAYYKLPIVPADWTEFSIPLSDMRAGIPNVAPADTAFDFASPRLQVFIWMRTEYEDGWPFQEDENHTYSVSVADIRLTTVLSGDPTPTHWGEFEIVDGWVNTGDWLGLLWVGAAPWVYSLDLEKFLFFPEEPTAGGAWTYILRP